MKKHVRFLFVQSAAILLSACGGGGATPAGTPDAGVPPSPDAFTVSTDHCTYEPMPTNANSTGTVTAGPLTAGTAEAVIGAPIGSALGGYSDRARFLNPDTAQVDQRVIPIAAGFYPSVGIETAPRAKALALSAGGETIIILKIDAVFVYEGMVFDLETRLGDAYHGKILIAASHSHSAWAQFTGHGALKVGAGELRDIVYQAELNALEAAARAALAAMRPAKIGFFIDDNFEPDNQNTHDRRSQNDGLPGGNRKDDHLRLIRIDGTDGQPIAIVPIYGVHGTLSDADNSLASVDAPGYTERLVQEQIDAPTGVPPVLVMHLQSAGADTAPTGHGDVDCTNPPANPTDPCFVWLTAEGHARVAAPVVMAAWQAAGMNMQDSIELEMISRSIELGPKPETFTIRNGALAYAPFDLNREADGIVYDAAGNLISPIDEFNAPVGAALCEDTNPLIPVGGIPGDEGLIPYDSCIRIDVAAGVLSSPLQLDLGVDSSHPICSMTRSTISAVRLGDYLIGTLPGEVSVLLADLARSNSPVDQDHTMVVGYAQGHVGYLLRPEDWVLGGYEPSVTFWGPLEAEYLEERLVEMWPMAMLPTRSDAAAGGLDKVATAHATDDFPSDNPAPMAGTVPDTIPAGVWIRSGMPAQAQPDVMIPRVSGLATFVWLGDDPMVATPKITLQRETTPGSGTFADIIRRSGRTVSDGDLLLEYTPVPAVRVVGQAQTHVWAVEWQAVPWMGAIGVDDLASRAGVPLGNYRFHVVGSTWTLDSQPFAVIPGGMVGSPVTLAGQMVTGTVTLDAEKGYRLMDLVAQSNRPVAYAMQPITLTFMLSGATLATATTTTDANGQYQVTNAAAALGDHVVITDQFGNSVTLALP